MVYPGGVVGWEFLWAQNVFLIFFQFMTGASLYTQETDYANPVLYPLRAVGSLDRGTLITVHALTGVLLVVLNAAFVRLWLGTQPPLTDLVAAKSVVALSTLALTGSILGMAFFGVSLYANVRPDGAVPLWRFEYAFSRKAHRALFVFVVLALGHHVFFVERVYLVWTAWVAEPNAFGVLILVTVAVWGVLAGQSLLMASEWLTGRMFSRWKKRYDRAVSVLGIAFAVTFALILSFTGLSSRSAFLLCLALGAAPPLFLFMVRRRRKGGSIRH